VFATGLESNFRFDLGSSENALPHGSFCFNEGAYQELLSGE